MNVVLIGFVEILQRTRYVSGVEKNGIILALGLATHSIAVPNLWLDRRDVASEL